MHVKLAQKKAVKHFAVHILHIIPLHVHFTSFTFLLYMCGKAGSSLDVRISHRFSLGVIEGNILRNNPCGALKTNNNT